MTKGLTGAGLNAILQKELGKTKDKEVHKIASAAIGYRKSSIKLSPCRAQQPYEVSYIKSKQKRKGNTSHPPPLCFAQQNIG